MSVLINSRDLQFILFELLNVETLCQSDRYAHCDKAMFEATLDTAHQIALDRFDPLAKICDEAEPRIEEGRTILPDGVANAVKAYVDAGLLNASADLSEGGLQLPVCISQACMALFVAANPALAVYPFVTNGVATVISNHGSEAQKKLFAGPLRAGLCPRHLYVRDIGNPGHTAFSRSNCETEPTCAGAERKTHTASNDIDICPSLVRLGTQNGPQRRPFRAVLRRLQRQPDSVAERGGFEPPVPRGLRWSSNRGLIGHDAPVPFGVIGTDPSRSPNRLDQSRP
jgi:hypothetical protein